MPLRCHAGDTEEIMAFTQSEESWAALKANYRQRKLKMVCCGMPAIPKTSSLGTFFFAHSRRGECTSAPESKEHLLAKTIIARAAIEAGWNVTTEHRGETTDGKEWFADVLAECNNIKIAFEVQWSSQQDEETTTRQKRYENSGVRCLWLFKQRDFKSSQKIPVFRLVIKEDSKGFTVKVPSYFDWFDKRTDEDYYWPQCVELDEFIKGCLQKKLKWAPAIGRKYSFRFDGALIPCWKCKKETRIILGLVVEISKVYPEHPDLFLKIYTFNACPDILQSLIPRDLYTKFKIGKITERYSNTERGKYLSNGCFHCGALQGRFFDHEYFQDSKPITTSEMVLSDAIISKIGKSSCSEIYRWYFIR